MSSPESLGLLLINLGTPASPSVQDVKNYLGAFLMDPYVIGLPTPLRWLLVHGIILNTRPQKSAQAYRSVWTEAGSPLLVESKKFKAALEAHPDARGWSRIELAMRFGAPSVSSALQAFHSSGIRKVTVFPLYPQYAESSFRTAVEHVKKEARQFDGKNHFQFQIVPPFFSDSGFLDAEAIRLKETLADFKADHTLFSFHGLPKAHVKKVETCAQHCFTHPNCCARIETLNSKCYRAQCFYTAREIARIAELPPSAWSVSFQSRLGPGWIQPFTDHIIPDLAKKGIRNLAVVCPAFVADCLETLEEIGGRAQELFRAAGGDALKLVPSLNDHPRWIQAAARIASQTAKKNY